MQSPRTRPDGGQMLPLFAICLVAIVAMTGLVIDSGMTFVQRRDQQNAADAAAMAGAYAFANSTDMTAVDPAARTAATANGYTAGADGAVVTVTPTLTNGIVNVVVTITKPHRNYFSGIVGFSTWDVSATATAIAGAPNAALGAMPIIFNKKAFPNWVGPSNETAFDQPGSGNEDVPQTASQFNWTVFCTANGNACNANSNDVRDIIDNKGKSTVVTLNDDIGPLNAGAHTTLFSALADHVGSEFPVAIVNDEGEFVGWAMFKLTGSVGGSTKQIRGYFVSPVNRSNLKIVQGGGKADANYGNTTVQLTN